MKARITAVIGGAVIAMSAVAPTHAAEATPLDSISTAR